MIRILLDLDCVLADFVAGCSFEWGFHPDDIYKHWPVGKYPMNEAIGAALGREPLTTTEFWDKLNGNAKFWEELPRLPWIRALIDEVNRVTEDWHVISSPSYCPSSYAGKVAWLKAEFGPKFNRFALTPHKEIFAQPGVILIDDHEGNVEKFRAAGGEAILFPAHHNQLYRFKHNPLDYVLGTLNDLRLKR